MTKRLLLLLVVLALGCNSGPTAPGCPDFFAAGASHATLSVVGTAGSSACVIDTKWSGLSIRQTGCSFAQIGDRPFVRGGFEASGQASLTIEAGGRVSGFGLSGTGNCSLVGVGTVSGSRISGTIETGDSCGCFHVGPSRATFTLTKE